MRWMLALVAGLWLGGFAARAEPVRQDISGLALAEIVALQRRLADAGCYKGALDGAASEATKAAVLACPDQRPRLVIETGMHVAQIKRISVDRACTLAATASYDKTLRLWSLPEGRLLRTIRSPIGDGDNGKLYGTALSPDGRQVVAGGWDARSEVNGEHSVYVFDASNGSMLARLGRYSSGIKPLAFSPDGHWLVAHIHSQGIVIFNVSAADPGSWTEAARDQSYKGDTYGSSWSGDGRLATVSWDGKLRLYGPTGPGFRKIKEIATLGGKQPFSVAFDPAQERLAVGYVDTTAVDIYDARDLRRIAAADTSGIDNGELGAVAWQADGKRLWAAGTYAVGSKPPAIAIPFDRFGRKFGQPVALAENTVLSLQPCGKGLAFASADPAFGLFGGTGIATTLHKTVAADMRGELGEAFTLAADAKSLRFGLGNGGESQVRFDLARSALQDAAAPDPALTRPRIDDLLVNKWQDQTNPAFAQKPISLDQNERSRSLSIRMDGKGFALGADFSLRAFDARGTQIWQKDVPSVAWGVNLSADGRIIVAAYGDGTIRWHRWSDGQELLALFVNRETKAWVAWTPSGYYSASPGGEAMIGWHVNRGWEQAADFFPADRFRTQFARADIVERILDTLDEAEAVKLANAGRSVKSETKSLLENLPPVISILSPAEGATIDGASLTITYIIRSPSGLPVDAVEARVDGRALAATRGLGSADTIKQCLADTSGLGRAEGALQGCRGTLTIDAPQNTAEIGLAARTGARFGEAAIVHVTRAASAAPADIVKPNLYALVIGVADYANPALKLGLPAKDATDFSAAMAHQKGGLYGNVTVRLLTDRAATVAAIKDGLGWLARSTTSRDIAVLYFAGHGDVDALTNGFYILPHEADPASLFATALSREEINIALDHIPGKRIVFLDACHSGAIVAGTATRGLGAFNVNDVVKDLANSDNGVVLFTASTGKQLSLENPAWGNGAFTKALVEGLGIDGIKGKADVLGKGTITLSGLEAYIDERVKDLTGNQQSPVLINPKGVPNFPLALAR